MAKLHQAHGFDASMVSSSIERQMVYCQAPEVARLLEGDGLFWQIAPLAEDFAKEINGPTVIVGSDPGIFSSSRARSHRAGSSKTHLHFGRGGYAAASRE